MTEIASQAIEASAALKGTAIGVGTIGPPAYMAAQQVCAIDYTSIHILAPLGVTLLTGIFLLLQIHTSISNKLKS